MQPFLIVVSFSGKKGSRPNPWERLPMSSRFAAIGEGNRLDSFKTFALPDPRSHRYDGIQEFAGRN
jgi:hypothetical protein